MGVDKLRADLNLQAGNGRDATTAAAFQENAWCADAFEVLVDSSRKEKCSICTDALYSDVDDIKDGKVTLVRLACRPHLNGVPVPNGSRLLHERHIVHKECMVAEIKDNRNQRVPH